MRGTWSRESLQGKAVDIYEPPRSTPPRFAILYLHPLGLETPQGRPAFTRFFDELNLPCVCPHGRQSWWVDRVLPLFDARLTPEKFVLEHVVPFCRARWRLSDRALGPLGISMGGQAALRLAFKFPKTFPVAAGISSAIDYHELHGQGTPLDELYDSKEQCRQDTATMHVPPYDYPPHLYFCIDPDDEDWYRGNDRLHEKLNALGIPHTVDLTTRGGGHSWEYFERMAEPAIRFIHAGLELESRRLL